MLQQYHDMPVEKRLTLSRIVFEVLRGWEIKEANLVNVLGFPEGTKPRALKCYSHDTPLPEDEAIMQRVDHILAIAEALRTTYPHNYRMGKSWLKTPHRRFNQRSPIDLILNDGLEGLISVRADLDCAYAWSLTDPNTAK